MSVYNVVITKSESAAPSDGFLDPTRVEIYMASGPSPTTYAKSKTKERGNIRWLTMLQQLNLVTLMYVQTVAAPSGDSNTAPTTLTFNISVENDDSYVRTADELNPGTFLVGIAAIKRAIARALIASQISDYAELYDPTTATAPGTTVAAVRVGSRIEALDVGAVAVSLAAGEALVAVTRIL